MTAQHRAGAQADDPVLSVIVVSGIFPPDIGGPATHASNLADELRRRGHRATVLTLTDSPRTTRSGGTVRYPRSWPASVRLAAVALWLLRHRGSYDVVYATGLHPAAVSGARLARRPVVVKIVGDPAWERATRLGLTGESFEDFQKSATPSAVARAMRWLRDRTVRHVSAVVVPSDYLRGAVVGWQRGRGPGPIVIPNGVVVPGALGGAGPARNPAGPLQVVFVGRLVAHKRVDALVRAVAETHGIELTVVGDGPELAGLRGLATSLAVAQRVRFTGVLAHGSVLDEVANADVMVSASAYEGLPHAVIEAFTLGTPVVVSDAGGSGEAVVDGENGRLVKPATTAAFAKVLGELRDDRAELGHLAGGARSSGVSWRFDRCADAVEDLLFGVTRPGDRPRIVNVGKSYIGDPPGGGVERKFGIVARHLDATFVVTGPPGVRRVAGVRVVTLPSPRPRLLGGAFFYAAAPVIALGTAAARPGGAVVCQSPFEAAGVLGLRRLLPVSRRPRVVVEVHGDWHAATRLYGSRWRHILSPGADRVAARAVRGADRVRVIGDFTEETVRRSGRHGEVDRYVAFSDYGAFLGRPPEPVPDAPAVVFVGVLEPCKSPEVLVAAWRDVSVRVPGARLWMVGAGSMETQLRSAAAALGIGTRIEFLGHVGQRRVAAFLDASWCLVLPSPREGLGRVVLEAMARGRSVVCSNSGGARELVEHGVTGLLVEPGDSEALAGALVHVLAGRDIAATMGAEARRRVEARDPAGEFESGVVRLADWVAGR